MGERVGGGTVGLLVGAGETGVSDPAGGAVVGFAAVGGSDPAVGGGPTAIGATIGATAIGCEQATGNKDTVTIHKIP